MNNSEQQLDQLFKAARSESPKIQLHRTEAIFEIAIGGIGALSLSKLLTFKTGFMGLGITGIIVATSVLLSSNLQDKKPFNTATIVEPIEVIDENKVIIVDEEELAVNEPVINRLTRLDYHIEVEDKSKVINLVYVKAIESRPDKVPNEIVITQINSTSSEVIVASTDSNQLFEITQNTTRQELDVIIELAKKAGAQMHCKYRRKRLTQISLNLSREGNHQVSSFKLGRKFNIKIGWKENQEGEAIALHPFQVNFSLTMGKIKVIMDSTMIEL
ncbi:MAG: hypothetical protein JKY54_06285, partial [Flavobacteriales bacterium]|nr:hypothetical protein [Flavobacteriales bacterium]